MSGQEQSQVIVKFDERIGDNGFIQKTVANQLAAINCPDSRLLGNMLKT
jgi:hypothetical protein